LDIFSTVDFWDAGWSGPHDLAHPEDAPSAAYAYRRQKSYFISPNNISHMSSDDILTGRWFKSTHYVLPEIRSIVSDPQILMKVSRLIGPSFIIWGAAITERAPAQVHRWHVDVEHKQWDGVTAFIGLENTSLRSGLSLIDKSHMLTVMPQSERFADNNDAESAAKQMDVRCRLSTPSLEDGQFILFAGCLWHASNNISDKHRTALVAHYSPTTSKVAIPLNWDPPIKWHPIPPPLLYVKDDTQMTGTFKITCAF
jgi:ectoine hydroxylase-related dioxygenase (phytanoyl-CoA dioxygenase family)